MRDELDLFILKITDNDVLSFTDLNTQHFGSIW